MVFNPDISKQAVEVIFSARTDKPLHRPLSFNGVPVARRPDTKHLGLYLDEKLSFSKHIKENILKAMNGISILKFLSKYVPKDILNLSYKLYVRPHLDYGDVIYHNQRADLMEYLEQVQYKAALVVSGCWQGTSRERLYRELGWEHLSDRRWFRRLTIFYKIINGMTPDYLRNHLPSQRTLPYNMRSHRDFDNPNRRTARYSNSFFPHCISEWENLGNEIKTLPSLSQFKTALLSFIRPTKSSSFGINDIHGIKLLTKLRVDFSDLRSHRYSHNFNCVSPICSCFEEEENNSHFLLRCPRFSLVRNDLIGNISASIGSDISVFPADHLTDILLYGSNAFNEVTNKLILSETIKFIRKSKRFDNLEAFLP